jgi:hypothetical protein
MLEELSFDALKPDCAAGWGREKTPSFEKKSELFIYTVAHFYIPFIQLNLVSLYK